jgi:hypothetical protein
VDTVLFVISMACESSTPDVDGCGIEWREIGLSVGKGSAVTCMVVVGGLESDLMTFHIHFI